MRMIDADKLTELCDIMAEKCDGIGESVWDQFRITVEWSPTVDAEPVRHGRWVKTGQSFLFPERFRNFSCSLCGYDIDKTKHRYCPNCGAKMDEVEE